MDSVHPLMQQEQVFGGIMCSLLGKDVYGKRKNVLHPWNYEMLKEKLRGACEAGRRGQKE